MQQSFNSVVFICLFNDDIFNDPVNVPNGRIVNEFTERGVAV